MDLYEMWRSFCRGYMPSVHDGNYAWSWAWMADNSVRSFVDMNGQYSYDRDYEQFKAAVEAGDAKALEILPKFVAFRLEQGG